MPNSSWCNELRPGFPTLARVPDPSQEPWGAQVQLVADLIRRRKCAVEPDVLRALFALSLTDAAPLQGKRAGADAYPASLCTVTAAASSM